MNGRLTRFGLPLGLLRFLRRKRHIKTARMVVLDVLKEYRRRGIAELLILRTLDYGKNVLGYTGAELGWTLEDNDSVNRTIEAVGAGATRPTGCTRRNSRRNLIAMRDIPPCQDDAQGIAYATALRRGPIRLIPRRKLPVTSAIPSPVAQLGRVDIRAAGH